MDQECIFEREDWNFTIRTTAEMTADQNHFFIHATVTCLDGEETFQTWNGNTKLTERGCDV